MGSRYKSITHKNVALNQDDQFDGHVEFSNVSTETTNESSSIDKKTREAMIEIAMPCTKIDNYNRQMIP